MPTGSVVRFDRRRGYGFITPDEPGEDVFVHQNNIQMDGFRFLNVGEKVNYDLEVGEKGMKAVSVSLLEPRAEVAGRPGFDQEQDFSDNRDNRDNRDNPEGFRARPNCDRPERPERAPVTRSGCSPRETLRCATPRVPGATCGRSSTPC